MRRRAHRDRPLRRRARQGAHRRPCRGPHQGASGAQRQSRLDAARRGFPRLRQSGRRGQPQCRAHGGLARRIAGFDPRHHRQPAVRLRPQRGRRRRARDPLRRNGVRHRRRRRIDDAGAVRHGQGRRGVFADRGSLRHHDRLAFHQSGAQGAIRRRFDGRDRRERGARNSRSPAPIRTLSRCARNSAPARPPPPAISPRRSCRSRRRAAKRGR